MGRGAARRPFLASSERWEKSRHTSLPMELAEKILKRALHVDPLRVFFDEKGIWLIIPYADKSDAHED